MLGSGNAVAAALLCIGCACGGVGRGDAHAPTGVRLEASAGVPALEMALTLEPVALADAAIAPLTSALHGALVACAPSGYAALDAGLTFGFRVHAGRLIAVPLQPAAASPLARCVSTALTRASIAALSGAEQLSVRVRAARTATAQGESRSRVHAP